jgi:N-acyl-phosphatidylethanolamine-hydrolysing phospholipase D
MLQRAARGRFGFTTTEAAPAVVSHAIRVPRADAGECRLTWIGHSTFLLQVGSLNVLTDPIFGDRASPVRWAGPRRHVRAAVPIEALPPIDLVLQSHDHYDHLDLFSVRSLASRFPAAAWCAPLGVGAWLRARGVPAVFERDWFGTVEVGQARATCLPAQHFSGRSARTRNTTLWCGWGLEAGGWRLWFLGDTAYHPDFTALSRRCGPFDAVLMPIGAYDPRWFMRPMHIDPEEAVAAYADIARAQPARPPVFVAMHWGTFTLTDEPLDEPPQRTRAAWRARGLDPGLLWILVPGETRVLGGGAR